MTARRRNGVWYCDFHYQGKRYRRKSPTNTKRGAEKYEQSLLRRVRRGLSIDDEPAVERPEPRAEVSTPPETRKEVPTFAAFAAEFMATYAKANNKPSVQTEKRSHLNCHLLPAFGDRTLDEIDTRAIEALKAKLLDGKRSRKRLNNILATLGRILSYAVEIEIIDKSPRVKLVKTEDRPVLFLGFDEYEALVSTAESDPLWHAAILLGGDAGLRLGEIRALRPAHWLRDQGCIDVQRSMWQSMETTTKGWKRRTIPLTERLQDALTRLDDSRRYLVATEETTPLTLETTRWHLPRLCGEAGLSRIGWHALRHTFCSHLAMLGVPARTIQELAGHADLTTTLRYMHLVPGEKERAIQVLNRRSDRDPREPAQ